MTEIISSEKNSFQKKLIFNQELLEKRIYDEQEKIINLELENEELRTMISSLTMITNDTLNSFNILKAEMNECNYKSLYFDLKSKYEREVGSLQRSNKILTNFLCEKQHDNKNSSNIKADALDPNVASPKKPSYQGHRKSISFDNKTNDKATCKEFNFINSPPKKSFTSEKKPNSPPVLGKTCSNDYYSCDAISVISDDKTPCLSSFTFSNLNDFAVAESPITEAKLGKLFEHKNISLVNMSRPVRNNNSGRIKLESPYSTSNSTFAQSSDEFTISDQESIQSSNFESAHSESKISLHTDTSSVMSNSSFNDSLESFSKFSFDKEDDKYCLASVIDDTPEDVKINDFEKPEKTIFKVRSRSNSASSVIRRFFK